MEIVKYSTAHREAVERLNTKLSAAGSEWVFPTEDRLPRDGEKPSVWTESFVAVEGEDVYGGYVLKHQQFFVRGRPLDLGDLQLPLSLGHIDRTYSHVSVALLFDVIRRSPHVYSLGLGSEDTEFAKLLTAARWQHVAVPFYFSVKSANRFARNIRLPSEKAILQYALRVLGHLRLAGVALKLRQLRAARSRSRPVRGAYDGVREVPRFDSAADELFAAHVESYSLVGDRRAAALNHLYPEGDEESIRVMVEKGGRSVGWGVVRDTSMRNDKYFGNLRVGSLADCFAAPEDASAVVSAMDDVLTRRGVDLVVSNQLHPAWCEALGEAGYQRGPSNFFFYFSDDLAKEMEAVAGWERGVHLNRGDGEGPGNL